MKILFFFAPTGASGEEYAAQQERTLSFSKDTIRIYLRGCQHPNIGDSLLTPNLDIAAEHIYHAFEDKQLNLTKLKNLLEDGIYKIYPESVEKNTEPASCIEVESIGLVGHSRGAVSTFAAAKKLNQLEIPIDIIANQPVPGELSDISPLTKRYKDLSSCEHIRSSTIFLATHSNYNAWWHNLFFKQLVPEFSEKTTTEHFLLPIHQHFDFHMFEQLGLYTNNRLSQQGYTSSDMDFTSKVKEYYAQETQKWWQVSFFPEQERQIIWGDNKPLAPDPIYLELQLDRANQALEQAEITPSQPLKTGQAAAIDYLSNTYFPIPKEYVHLILTDTPQGKRFCHIINTVSETCLYVATLNRTMHSKTDKSDAIKKASINYQQVVFTHTYDFLALEKPDAKAQAHFKNEIYLAEKIFRKNALGMEMNYGRYLLKFLTNFLLHATGIGLIANVLHKQQTGNWLFFNHNRSTTIIKRMRESLFNDEEDSKPKPTL